MSAGSPLASLPNYRDIAPGDVDDPFAVEVVAPIDTSTVDEARTAAVAAVALQIANMLRFDASQALTVAQQAQVRANVGLVPGTDVQAYDADLAAIAALATDPFGRNLLTRSSGAGVRDLIGATIGTNVQAWDADLDAIAALTTSAFGRSLLTMADATAVKNALASPYITAQSLGSIGYRRWSDGVIEQWGYQTGSSGNQTVTFPVSMNACDMLSVTIANVPTASTTLESIATANITASNFLACPRYNNGSQIGFAGEPFFWYVRGRV